jgi:acid phosphatase
MEYIYSNETLCNKLYNAEMFWEHLEKGILPQFVYFVPNLLNDGHDTNSSYFADYIEKTWIKTFYQNQYFNDRALNYVSLDESGNTTGFNTVPGDNNNHVYAAIWGDAVQNRDIYDKYDFVRYNHSSITATLEVNWFGKAGLLGRNDTYAPVFSLPYDGCT